MQEVSEPGVNRTSSDKWRMDLEVVRREWPRVGTTRVGLELVRRERV